MKKMFGMLAFGLPPSGGNIFLSVCDYYGLHK